MGRSPAIKPPQIEGYECEVFLGEGATGHVFRAKHHRAGPVALKVLKRLGVNRNLIGYSLSRLRHLPQHPNLVEIVDFSMEGKPLYQATSLHAVSGAAEGDGQVAGGFTLEPLCGRVAPEMAWTMIRQICEGMAYLHTHGVFHCSLNPKNVMVANPDVPEVKVTDFAQGWLTEISHIDFSESFLYAPPEQLREPRQMFEGQAQRWDVYAFGGTAYRMLYERFARGHEWIASLQQGAIPFHPMALADAVAQEPEIEWPEVADPFEEQRLGVLKKCLQLDPAKRYSDVREVLEHFEKIERDEKLAIERQENEERELVLSEKVAAGRRRLGHWRWAAIGLFAGLIASLILNVTSESRLVKRRQEIVDLKASSQRELGEAKREERRAKEDALRLKSNLTYAQSTADAFLEFLLNAKSPNSPEYQSIDGYLNSARHHYERVLRTTEGDKVLAVERLRAQLGLARIEAQLGDLEKAGAKLDQLLREIENLPPEVKQLSDVEETLGAALLETGKAKMTAGLRAEALEKLQESVRVFKKQLTTAPQNLDLKRRLGRALFYYGQQLARAGDLKTALKSEESAMQVLEGLAQSADAREEDEYYLALCQFEVGLICIWENENIRAFESFQLASRGYSRLMDEKPHIPEYRFQLARCLYYLGDLSFQVKGDEEESALARQSMYELLALLLEKDEANREYQYYFALVLVDLAEMARDAGERESAFETLEKALIILSELHKADPEDADVTFRLALARSAEGDLHLDSKETAKALEQMEKAESLFQEIEDKGRKTGLPDHVYRFRESAVISSHAHALEVHQEAGKAAEYFKRAQEILTELAAQRPADERIGDALKAVGSRSSS